MAPTPNNLRLRLPKALAERVRDEAEHNGVSINSLLIALIAGSLGFDLKPDPKPTGKPTKEAPAGAATPPGPDRSGGTHHEQHDER